MKANISILTGLTFWFLLSVGAQATILVKKQALTANLFDESLSSVLGEIQKQTNITVAILDPVDYNSALVSDVFGELPLEQGLERLLKGWNYGISKHFQTGEVQMVVIGSRRKPMADMALLHANEVSPNGSLSKREEPSIQEFSGEGAMEGWEDYPSNDQTYQTEEDVLANAPPNVRPFIERMLHREENR